MNDRQIAFIICSNNAQYYNECVRYITELCVPDGYDVDIICVQEAESMAQGYNAGMQSSDAKYKVYLHQDVFIMNRIFIYDIIRIFADDEQIGMLGVIGATRLPDDANLCFKWNTGRIEAYDGFSTIDGDAAQNKQRLYIPVRAIDGLIMVTQYDVPWREDFLDGWDFYDVSQSLEMQKHGYKVVVPYQENPWCYHDCGVSKLENYDFYRARIIEAYPEVFSDCVSGEKIESKKEKIKEIIKVRCGLIRLMELKAYDKIEEIIEKLDLEKYPDTQICEIVNLMEIYALEKGSTSDIRSEWFDINEWDRIREYYTWVRFVLIRAGYQKEDERIAELRDKVEQGRLSVDAVRKIATAVVKDTTPIYKLFFSEISTKPLVSVIIRVQNGAEMLRQTVESILGQTYKNMEVIIGDDASSDKSREVISSLAQADERIKFICFEEKQNNSYVENQCAEIAKGKYLALAGQDDIWREDKLEKQIMFLEEHPMYGACFTWADVIDENGCINNRAWFKLYVRFRSMNTSREEWIRKLFFEENYFCTSSACIRKELLYKAGLFHYGLVRYKDYYLWLKVLLETPVYIIQEKLTEYRGTEKKRKKSDTADLKPQRCCHYELQWIREDIVKHLSPQSFVQTFRPDMHNPNAVGEKEIQCEKAFLLWKAGCCLAGKWFIELLEDIESREILETEYGFNLQEFYEMNGEKNV